MVELFFVFSLLNKRLQEASNEAMQLQNYTAKVESQLAESTNENKTIKEENMKLCRKVS